MTYFIFTASNYLLVVLIALIFKWLNFGPTIDSRVNLTVFPTIIMSFIGTLSYLSFLMHLLLLMVNMKHLVSFIVEIVAFYRGFAHHNVGFLSVVSGIDRGWFIHFLVIKFGFCHHVPNVHSFLLLDCVDCVFLADLILNQVIDGVVRPPLNRRFLRIVLIWVIKCLTIAIEVNDDWLINNNILLDGSISWPRFAPINFHLLHNLPHFASLQPIVHMLYPLHITLSLMLIKVLYNSPFLFLLLHVNTLITKKVSIWNILSLRRTRQFWVLMSLRIVN
jgi:hypothetical protein